MSFADPSTPILIIFLDMSSSEESPAHEYVVDSGSDRGNENSKAKKRRSTPRVTPNKRVAQFPGEFVVRGEAMWCTACQYAVDHREISFAKGHLKSAKHLKNKKRLFSHVFVPGPSIAVPSQYSESAQSSTQSSLGMN